MIKVLDHESKVYKFEKDVIGTLNVDDMNPEYENTQSEQNEERY